MMRKFDLLSSLRLPSGDLKFLFFSLFAWTFGAGLYQYIWPPFLRDIGANDYQVGIVLALGFLAGALTMIPGGLLANKYDLKPLIIISWALSIPTSLIFYFAQNWTNALPGYILLQVTAFSLPAFNAYIAAAANRGRVSSAFGITYAAAPLGIILSPTIGGILLTWLTVRDLFLLSALIFTISTLILLPIKPQPPLPQTPRPPIIEPPRSREEKTLFLYLLAAAIAISMSIQLLPLFYADLLLLSKSQIQYVGAIQSAGGTVLSVVLARRAEHRGKGETMAWGLLLGAGGLVALIFLRNPFLVLPFIFFAGGARGSGLIAYSALSGLGGNSTMAGRFGLYLTAEWLGLAAGPYIGGLLYSFNPVSILAVSAVGLVLLAEFARREVRG